MHLETAFFFSAVMALEKALSSFLLALCLDEALLVAQTKTSMPAVPVQPILAAVPSATWSEILPSETCAHLQTVPA
jgi:hypothetical protein